jgi:hypothetical protein
MSASFLLEGLTQGVDELAGERLAFVAPDRAEVIGQSEEEGALGGVVGGEKPPAVKPERD